MPPSHPDGTLVSVEVLHDLLDAGDETAAEVRRLRAELAEAARLLDTAAQLADHGHPLSSATLYAGADKIRAALADGRWPMQRVCLASAALAFAAGAGLALLELCDTAGWLTLAVIAAGEAADLAIGTGRRVEPG